MSKKMRELTPKEKAAVTALRMLAKEWPKSLWLYSASGSLHIMRKSASGARIMTDTGGFDGDACVETINIENDGGDW